MAWEVFSGVPGVGGSWGETHEWEVVGREGEFLVALRLNVGGMGGRIMGADGEGE